MINNLPQKLYTASKIRKLDQLAIESFGYVSFDLMLSAGREIFNFISAHFSKEKTIIVWCGKGNNAGDGYVVALLAKLMGWNVKVVTPYAHELLTPSAEKARQLCQLAGVCIQSTINDNDPSFILVDALLGTGTVGKVNETFTNLINLFNQQSGIKIAIDIPSGLNADTGQPLGTAIKADVTITFIGLKQGLLTGKGPYYCGKLLFSDLDIKQAVYDQVIADGYRLVKEQLQSLYTPRVSYAHKGLFGNVLIVGGNHGMAGAISLASQASLSCGAGRVYVGTRSKHTNIINIRNPEIMTYALDTPDLISIVKQKSALLIGPGLGQDHWSIELLKQALSTNIPLLLDADALNLLANGSVLFKRPDHAVTLLTPHPGEAARLLNISIEQVESDRFYYAKQLADSYQATVILKGSGSIIVNAETTAFYLCDAGNPEMATPGMGDVLAGIVITFLGRGFKAIDAAKLGVWLHAKAGDAQAKKAPYSVVLASEIMIELRQLFNQLVDNQS